MPLCPRCPGVLVAVPLAAVHALCSPPQKRLRKTREKCVKVSVEPEHRPPRCESADAWCSLGGLRPLELRLPLSHWSPAMNEATSTVCVCARARVRLYVRARVHTAPKMRDGDLSGTCEVWHQRPKQNVSLLTETLASDKKPVIISAENSRRV